MSDDVVRAHMEAILKGRGLCHDCENETDGEELVDNRDGKDLLCSPCRRARDDHYREAVRE